MYYYTKTDSALHCTVLLYCTALLSRIITMLLLHFKLYIDYIVHTMPGCATNGTLIIVSAVFYAVLLLLLLCTITIYFVLFYCTTIILLNTALLLNKLFLLCSIICAWDSSS